MTWRLSNLIGGQAVAATGGDTTGILNPADGRTVVAEYVQSSANDVAEAVRVAADAFPAWRAMPVVRRCRILFHIKELLEQRQTELAELLVAENGKTLAEAEAEIRRGIEVVEFAAGMPSLAKGDFIEDIATQVDGMIYREPLGVVAGVCPFNFPVMIPLWLVPVALACGNTFVLKPSDKCPASAARLAELFTEGGLPDGVLNVVHGGREAVEAMIADPRVAAVSSVGSTAVARSIWELAGKHHKRVQALGGAKNYIVVMPDADPTEMVKAVIGSAYGCAGQRCMAASVLVLVGDAERMLDRVAEAAGDLTLGDGMDPATAMGPVISADAKQRIEGWIATGIDEGAAALLDGRGVTVPGLENGFFVGPTVLDGVRPDMRIACEEVFGPVLCVMQAADLDGAIDLANAGPYGNGASIFTASGGAARHFRHQIECGMIGINAGVPAPMAFFSFGGFKDSIFGDLRAHGPDGIEFYTRKKAVIERWFEIASPGSVWSK